MRFDHVDFDEFILENKVIEFFKDELMLASGRKSHWYVNWRKISNDVFLIDELTDYVINFVTSKGINPDCFYGVPEGATKLGLITQYKWATRHSDEYDKGTHCFPMGRGKSKNHGDPKDKYFIGEPLGQVVMLEDVTTTGSSLVKACLGVLELKEHIPKRPKIIKAISLTDRMEITDQIERIPAKISVKEALRLFDIDYESMTDAKILIPKAIKKYNLSIDIIRSIEQEFDLYGVEKLKF